MPVTNRLDFFRKEMAAFAGAAFPQQAISDGYYIREPRKSVSEVITGRIALRPASTHLLLGGVGSGKTTQLLMTRDRIKKELDDTEAFYIDASDYTDIAKISNGVLTIIVGLFLCELTEDYGNSNIKESIRKIHKLAYGYEVEETISISSPYSFPYAFGLRDPRTVKKHIQGILAKDRQVNSLVKSIKVLSDFMSSESQKIVLLIDGLDRLNDSATFLKVVANDFQEMTDLSIGIVLVGASHNFYDPSFVEVKKIFDYSINQSCYDVEEDTVSRAFCQSIIASRSSPGFIDESASSRLVHYSGGILRDLISLTQLAIEEAYILDDGDKVTLEHVEIAAENSASMKLLDLSNEDMEILSKVATGNSFMPHGAEQLRLIANSNIIEYTYPKRRYVVHPCLRKYLLVESSS